MSRRSKRMVILVVELAGVGAIGVNRLRHRGPASALAARGVTPAHTAGFFGAPWALGGGSASESAAAGAAEQEARRQEQQREHSQAVAETDRLTAAVGLSEGQRARATRILAAIEHARSMVARAPNQDDDARRAQEQQIDQQERLALLAVVTSPQQPLLDSYFGKR